MFMVVIPNCIPKTNPYEMKCKLLILFTLISACSFAQKKTIDHTAYDQWKRLSENELSRTGKFVTYEINPHKGDGYLYVYNVETAQLDSFVRGKGATISFDESYLVFTIKPGYDTLRNCELQKVDKKKWPKDTLAVYVFATDSLMKLSGIKSHQCGKKNSWLTYLEEENKLPESGKKKRKRRNKKETEPVSEGTVLRVWHPASGITHAIKNVTDYSLSETGQYVAYTTNLDKEYAFNLLNTLTGETKSTAGRYTAIKTYAWSKRENELAFLTSIDTAKTDKQYNLYLYRMELAGEQLIVDSTDTAFPDGQSVSEHRRLSFSPDGRYLFFGGGSIPRADEKDTLLESEKPKLDLWHYKDGRLQPQQLKELKRDQSKTDLYVYVTANGNVSRLSNDTLEVSLPKELVGDYLKGVVTGAYELAYQWDMSGREDVYRIHIPDGNTELLKKAVRYNMELSPNGERFVYFDYDSGNYKSLEISSKDEKCLTCGLSDVTWTEDINGMPMDAEPVGALGWDRSGEKVYLRSRHDLYAYDFLWDTLNCSTNTMGRDGKIQFSPYYWDRDSAFVDLQNVFFIGLDERTKGSHVLVHRKEGFETAGYWDATVVQLARAKEGALVSIRKQTVTDYPELELTSEAFADFRTISNTNPQQDAYNWARVELVKWNSYDGQELEGLLYKPEDFDPNKNYPLLVYFYELYADKLHAHYAPKPTASIIYPTEYASAGYIVFIPDIRYKPGYPAQSAYNCIMSGTDKVLELVPNVDSSRMGLQGQSWGGYQTAQLITMTKRYAAAMAGAPVSNMFSAYGGIRWGSGINRQFQYEKTQSRIGKTIWEAPELYAENSPLFRLPEVETPLLIMHNDGDGAVPWYQGIELYTGMRRLGKPCWLLNYNDDDHNLMKDANRRDLSIRMRQFFDYYLNNQPAPLWLTEGIPALKKGEELRYELDQN